MNGKQKIVIIIMDGMLLAELAVSMYLGWRNPENLTVVFLKTFLPAVVITLAMARIFVKRLATQRI